MKEKYVLVDIITSGKNPWDSSILALGACIPFEKNKSFYSELTPITQNYDISHLKSACKSLNLNVYDSPWLDPGDQYFYPDQVLRIFSESSQDPRTAIPEFINWTLENTSGYKPVFVAEPYEKTKRFLDFYIDKFYNGKNPFEEDEILIKDASLLASLAFKKTMFEKELFGLKKF